MGFPIRKSPDIMPVCGSPGLIAACHVLHRLLLPRHPPCALSSLTIKFTQYTGQSAFGTQHSAKSLQPIAYRLLLIARSAFQLYVLLHLCSSRRFTSPHQQRSKALIKFTSALCFPKSIQLSKISCPLSGTRRISDSRTVDPLELFASARYHIVTESTRLADLLSNVGRQTASTWNRCLLIKTVAVLMPNIGQKSFRDFVIV